MITPVSNDTKWWLINVNNFHLLITIEQTTECLLCGGNARVSKGMISETVTMVTCQTQVKLITLMMAIEMHWTKNLDTVHAGSLTLFIHTPKCIAVVVSCYQLHLYELSFCLRSNVCTVCTFLIFQWRQEILTRNSDVSLIKSNDDRNHSRLCTSEQIISVSTVRIWMFSQIFGNTSTNNCL